MADLADLAPLGSADDARLIPSAYLGVTGTTALRSGDLVIATAGQQSFALLASRPLLVLG